MPFLRKKADNANLNSNLSWFNKRVSSIVIAIIAVLMCFVIAATFISSIKELNKIARSRFDIQVETSMFQLSRRYESAVTVLKSARGLFDGSDLVTLTDFQHFVDSTDFRLIFPKIGSLGFIPRVLEKDREKFIETSRGPVDSGGVGEPTYKITPGDISEEYWPTLFYYPPSNAVILGNDQRAEPVRRANIEHARDIGDVSMSNDVTLRSSNKTGAILAVPIYSTKSVPDTIEERRKTFVGVVAFSFNYEDFPLGSMPVPTLQNHGINVFISSYGGKAVPYVVSPHSEAWTSKLFGSLFGQLYSEQKLLLNRASDTVNVYFGAPAISLLSTAEIMEPFGIVLMLIIITTIVCLTILFQQKTKNYSELRKRYDFITTLAHQLRTPLSKASWGIELLKDENTSAREESIEAIKGGITSLISIVNDFLLFLEWGEMKKLTGTEPSLSLSEIVKEAISSLHLDPNDTRLKVDLGDAGDKKIMADLKKLSTALAFLIDNALVYSSKQTQVKVKASVEKKTVRIDVVDKGIGIPEAEQKLVWSFFYRGTNASLGKNEGSGVGLSLCRVLVEAHGGTVGFISKDEQGSDFYVILPIASD